MTSVEASCKSSHDQDEIDWIRVWDKVKLVALRFWGRTTRRMRIAGALIVFLFSSLLLSYSQLRNGHLSLPSVSFEFDYQKQASKFNESKVALLIENRPMPLLAPLMLHFISVVPPDWRFRFMGSIESVEHLNKSVAIREQVVTGKLDLTYIPSNMTTGSQEEISRFLTNLWLYEVVLQPAEWLLVFQTDSILCANSRQTLNDYLDYDWVGAPWNTKGRYGGNGGLSLRRVSAIIDVLRNQERVDGSEPEDVWLTDRLGHRLGGKVANGSVSATFSGEMRAGQPVKINKEGQTSPPEASAYRGIYNSTLDAVQPDDYIKGVDEWRDGFYEPMGYHMGGSGTKLHGAVWGHPDSRKHIFKYCPEVKLALHMDVARYVPGNCGNQWHRRDLGADVASSVDLGWGTEIIDGEEYPLLPEGLTPW